VADSASYSGGEFGSFGGVVLAEESAGDFSLRSWCCSFPSIPLLAMIVPAAWVGVLCFSSIVVLASIAVAAIRESQKVAIADWCMVCTIKGKVVVRLHVSGIRTDWHRFALVTVAYPLHVRRL